MTDYQTPDPGQGSVLGQHQNDGRQGNLEAVIAPAGDDWTLYSPAIRFSMVLEARNLFSTQNDRAFCCEFLG